jgi:hypothetical protein
MNPAITTSDNEWLNGSQAARLLGVSPTALYRAALVRHVETRLEPGLPIRYSRADCERLAQARRRLRPATTEAAT